MAKKVSEKMKKYFLIFLCLIFSIPVLAQNETLKGNFMQGERAFQSGDYEKAIQFYEQVVEIDPDFAPVYNALGLAHHAAGSRLTEVVWFFQVATDLNPDYTEAYANLCKIYFEEAEHDRAEKACLKALEIDPNLGSAQLQLAWVYLAGKQEPHQAIPYFERVLERVQNPMVYFGLGLAYAHSGDHARALETITLLRGMAENELAIQLEDALRAVQEPPPAVEQSGRSKTSVMPQRQKGTLIEAQPEPPPVPPSAQPSTVSGQMRIRLKGSLFDGE